MDKKEILAKVDHTLLKADATWPDIQKICDEAMENHTASICINPGYVKQACEYMKGAIPVCTVVGFPLGATDTATKVFEAKTAIENGAEEVDMVINIGRLKAGDVAFVTDEIAATEMLWDLYETVPELAAQWDNEYKLLQLYANPPMQFASKQPITSLADIQGMNIRCPSGAITNVLTAWGANPIMLSVADIYEAMEKNNIDAYIYEPHGIVNFSLQEVTNYYLDMFLYTGPFAIAMNWDSWNGLPAEYQEAIDSVSGREASLDSAQAFSDAIDAAREEIVASNGSNGQPGEFITLTDEEMAEWQVAADEYAAQWCEEITASNAGVDGAEFLQLAKETYAQYG